MKCLVLILIVLLHWSTPATAMCMYRADAGFIHADLERLPSNARGVLMLAPTSERNAISATSFAITSDQSAQPLAARIEWLTWEDQRQLVRIGPAGGFQAGARYTIRYLGATRAWEYPASITLTIDAQPLHSAPIELVQDGAPSHRLLDLDRGHVLTGATPRAAVDLRYVLSPQYQPYASAMMYWTSGRQLEGNFTNLNERAGACIDPRPGSTRAGTGRELLHTSCKTPGKPMEALGRAGLLEVEDATRATNLLRVDFDHAANELCDGGAILQQALANDDLDTIRSTICKLETSFDRATPLPASQLPAMDALLALADIRDAPPQRCIMYAATYRISATISADPRDQAMLGDFLRKQLASHDRERVASGLDDIDTLTHSRLFRAFNRAESRQRQAGVLAPLAPALTALAQGDDRSLAKEAAAILVYIKQLTTPAPTPANLTPGAPPAPR